MLRKLACATLFAFPLAALAVEPGEWELTIQAVMTGAQKPAASTKTQCLTEADARDPSRVLGAGGSCKFSNKNETAGAFSFDVDCTGLLPMHGKGNVIYTANSLQGELDLQATADTNFKMQTLMKGRRLGPC
jgi:hypothetical protein